MVNYTTTALRRPHSINTSFISSHMNNRNNNPDPPQQFQHFPSNPYEQQILKKELLLKAPIKEKEYYNMEDNNNNNNAIVDNNNNSVSLIDSGNMDIVPNNLSLHNNFARQDSLDLSALPLDPTLLYPSNSIFTEPNNTNLTTVISGPSAPFRQTSIDSPYRTGYQNLYNYSYSLVDQATPILPSFNRQTSFELMAKQEQQIDNNNNTTHYLSYGEVPTTEQLLPASHIEAPADIQYEQSAAAESYSSDSTNDEMPPLSPLPLELPSPTHLPIGRLSRFLSQGAQIHEYERQAEEIKHHHPIAVATGTSSFGRNRKRKADSEFTYDSDDLDSTLDGESTISTNTSFMSETDSEWLQHYQASPSLGDIDYSTGQINPNSTQLKHKKRRKGDKKTPHEKYRHVKSAMKLKTGGENQESVIVDIIPIYYPRPDDKPYKVRLIQVTNTQDQTIQALIHAADLGGVVERKSNISRLFGKFESPSEKLLMNVIGSHNHQIGQESNILTEKGVRRFLTVNKMRGQEHYKQWILKALLPKVHELNKQIYDPIAAEKRLKAEGNNKSNQQIHSVDMNSTGSVVNTPSDSSLYSSSPADSLAPIHENPSETAMTDLNL